MVCTQQLSDARNEYLLALAAANAHLDLYYLTHLPETMKVSSVDSLTVFTFPILGKCINWAHCVVFKSKYFLQCFGMSDMDVEKFYLK